MRKHSIKKFVLNAFGIMVILASAMMGGAQGQEYLKIISTYPTYSIVSLGALAGFTRSLAYGLNDRGEVVGSLESRSDLPSHVFLWSKRRLHDLGTIPSPYGETAPFAIKKVSLNNKGLIVVSWSVLSTWTKISLHYY